MKEKHIGGIELKGIFHQGLAGFAREKIRKHLQDLLEEEVSEWLEREKSEHEVKCFGTAGVSQRLRQAPAVHDGSGDGADTTAAGQGFRGAV